MAERALDVATAPGREARTYEIDARLALVKVRVQTDRAYRPQADLDLIARLIDSTGSTLSADAPRRAPSNDRLIVPGPPGAAGKAALSAMRRFGAPPPRSSPPLHGMGANGHAERVAREFSFSAGSLDPVSLWLGAG